MKALRTTLATLFLVGSVAGVNAQQTQASTTPAAAAQDCAKQVPRHDHGAERGIPTPKARASGCLPEAAASGAATRKPKPTHDHAKTHKNQ